MYTYKCIFMAAGTPLRDTILNNEIIKYLKFCLFISLNEKKIFIRIFFISSEVTGRNYT